MKVHDPRRARGEKYLRGGPLRRLFEYLVTKVFAGELGVRDWPVIDYLSDLLVRFVHVDNIFRVRDARGRPLSQVADMLASIEQVPPEFIFMRKRFVHKHIGDFTLFWTGVYPEALKFLRGPLSKDSFVDYIDQGRRSYMIAARYSPPELRQEAIVLARLADAFEVAVWGLHRVRQHWQRHDPYSYEAAREILAG